MPTYIRRIKNPVKRQYALDYWSYLTRGGVEPALPADLGYMAAQAVRLELHELIKQ